MGQYADLLDEAVEATLADTGGDESTARSAVDSAVQSVLSEDRTALRSSLYGAAGGSPDEAAKAAKLARTTGKPGEVILRNLREVERLALVDELEQKAFASPALAKRMREDRIFAQQAQDDADTLGGIETTIRMLKNLPPAAAAGVHRLGGGLWGAAAAPFEVAGQAFGAAEAGIARMMGADGHEPGNVGTKVGGFLLNEQRAADAVAQRVGPQVPTDAGVFERGLYSGVQSLPTSALALSVGMLPGGQNAALGILGATPGGASFARERSSRA